MSWASLFFAIDVANVVCAALLGARILISAPRQRNTQLIALIAAAVVCHVVLARYDYAFWIPQAYQVGVGSWAPVLNLARNTVPGLFMILIFRLFSDEPQFPRWLLALFAMQLFLEEPARWFIPPDSAYLRLATDIAPTLLQTLFAGLSIYWTIADWRADLIEARRRTRAVVTIILAVDVVASSLLLRVLIPQNTFANYETYLYLSAANLMLIAFLLLRLDASDFARFLETTPVRRAASPERNGTRQTETDAALTRLRALLEDEHIYRQPGLSLAGLAERAGLPEYRLRRLIHEELGFRNFNTFLHSYRIKEACAQLNDPAMRRTPVLTIALSVGYQSINTFNRGFREIVGETPSAYRNRQDGGAPEAEILSPESE